MKDRAKRAAFATVTLSFMAGGIVTYYCNHLYLSLPKNDFFSPIADGMIPTEGQVKNLFGGIGNIKLLNQAIITLAQRLEPKPEGSRFDIKNYSVSSNSVGITHELRSKIISVLKSPYSYGWRTTKACVPNYGVQLRFEMEDDVLDVLLCFECNLLGIFKNGQQVGMEDFDPIRPELVRIVKMLFPSDPDITNLSLH